MEFPLLSIIIPVYNVYNELRRCLDSAVEQRYPNVEFLVIDDGSTDGCSEICDEYAEKHKNFNIFHIRNSGLSSARNYALERASGDYVAFLDSDDYVDSSMYLDLMNQIIKDSSDIVFCEFYEKHSDGHEVRYHEKCLRALCDTPNNMRPLFEIHSWKRTDTDKSSKSMLKCVWRSIYKRSIIEKHHIRFDPKARWGEDALFLTEYLQYCSKGSLVNKPLYYYCVRKGSLVQQYKKNFLSVRRYLFSKESALIDSNSYNTNKEKKFLINELRLTNCMALVLNATREPEHAYMRLKELGSDSFFKSLLPWGCVVQSIACKRSIKYLFFFMAVKFKMWKLLALVH